MNKKLNIKRIIVIAIVSVLLFIISFYIVECIRIETIYRQAEMDSVDGKVKIRFVDGEYVGQMTNRILSGYGEYKLDTGDSYRGEWKENLPDGEGVLVIDGLGYYEGNYKEGKRNGEGKFYWDNGEIYDGLWEEDKPAHGGTLYFTDGTYYEGTFKEDGTFDSGSHYFVGDEVVIYNYYSDGGVYSYTSAEYKDGLTYGGKVNSEGKFEGYCTITYENGDTYEGYVENNKRNGKGKYVFKNDNKSSYYEGEWENDYFISGIYVYNYGIFVPEESITGDFVDFIPDGKCKYRKDFENYTTIWENGKCVEVKKGYE